MVQSPKVIFLDAVGTLFGVRGSVGQIYREIALEHGVDAPADLLNTAFFQSFKAADPMAFPGLHPDDIPQHEFGWWWVIAAETFRKVEKLKQFNNFSLFFSDLYDYFETAKPWYVYSDVLNTLSYWQSQGIQLGVLSNFDSRLHKVIPALQLDSFFSSITISTEVGAAKPSAKIFQTALEKHDCTPHQAWHIGDSYREDYQGAKAAGIRGIWLKRRS